LRAPRRDDVKAIVTLAGDRRVAEKRRVFRIPTVPPTPNNS
jgi:hypothetical protein